MAQHVSHRMVPAGLLVLGVAIAIRLIYFRDLLSFPLVDAPVMDAQYHHEWARQLAAGDWWGREVFFRAPAYPYFLGLIYRVFGENLLLPRFIQLLIGAGNCVLIYCIGRDLMNRKVGIVAGLIAALYGPLVYFDGELLIEVLMVFASLLSLWLLIRGWHLAGGLLLGLAAITRPNILIFILFVPVFLFFRSRDSNRYSWQALWKLALPWIGAGLVILPITLRNWMVGHDFVLISSQGGVNYYIGNNPKSNGITAVVPGTRASWWGGYHDTIRIAETAAGRPLKASEVSQYWFQQAFAYIREQPAHWLGLMVRKTYIFWQGFEPPNNEDLYAFAQFSPFLRLLIWKCRVLFFPFGLLAPLALCGMIVSLADWRRHLLPMGFIVLYAASVIAFFVCARFRMPVVPVLIPYAACFGVWLWDARRRPVAWALAALCAGLMVLANADLLKLADIDYGDTEHTLGNYYSEKKMYGKALNYYQQALSKNPRRPDVLNNIGNVYMDEGRLEDAAQAYQRALAMDARHATSHHNLGVLYLRAGQPDLALEYLLTAMRLDPGNPSDKTNILGVCRAMQEQADKKLAMSPEKTEPRPSLAVPYYRLGFAYYQVNEMALALAAYQKASEICPTFADAYNDRANVLNQLGRTPEAKALYLQALEVNSEYVPACRNLALIYEAEGDLQRAAACRRKIPSSPVPAPKPGAWHSPPNQTGSP